MNRLCQGARSRKIGDWLSFGVAQKNATNLMLEDLRRRYMVLRENVNELFYRKLKISNSKLLSP